MRTIPELEALVEAAEVYQRAADIEVARLKAELAEAKGDAEEATYRRAYALAHETRTPETHEAFMRIAAERSARLIIEGRETIDAYVAWQRPRILAALERLRGAQAEATP